MPRPTIDSLEPRLMLRTPTAADTYMVELINRARASPTLEAARYGIGLNEGLNTNQISTSAKQPYAINQFLEQSAFDQAFFIQTNGTVTYVGTGGSLPQDRMTAAGYSFAGTPSGSQENINGLVPTLSAGAITQAELDQIHRNLFVDNGLPNRPNRVNMLAEGFKEVGSGFRKGDWGTDATPPTGLASVQDFALNSNNPGGDQFLTGVAYDDTNGNGFYDIGEGLNNVTISARDTTSNTTFTTTSLQFGSYALRLNAGTYDVIATGTGLNGSVRYSAVIVTTKNVKRDFTPQMAGGTIPTPGTGVVPTTPNPVTLKGDLQGKLFVDRNGNGKRDKKIDVASLDGLKIYADINKNNQRDATEPYGVVLKKGTWNITGLDAGIYQIAVETPDGYRVSVPGETFRTVVLGAGQFKKVKDLLITSRTLISGKIYRDDNNSGSFDVGVEKGLKNWRVFADLNNDGIWQRLSEPSVKSNSNGSYAFRDLLPTTYTIRVIPQVGYLQTEPINNGFYVVQVPADGLSVTGRDFGMRRLI